VEAILVRYVDRNLQNWHRCHTWYCWLKKTHFTRNIWLCFMSNSLPNFSPRHPMIHCVSPPKQKLKKKVARPPFCYFTLHKSIILTKFLELYFAIDLVYFASETKIKRAVFPASQVHAPVTLSLLIVGFMNYDARVGFSGIILV